jgi:hypothetical protein
MFCDGKLLKVIQFDYLTPKYDRRPTSKILGVASGMDEQTAAEPSSKDEIFHILGWLFRTYASVMRFLDTFATNSPALYGYMLIVGGIGIGIYAARRRFASDQRIEDDWNSKYGRMMIGGFTNSLLSWTKSIVIFLGLLILFRVYLPGLFRALFNLLTPG